MYYLFRLMFGFFLLLFGELNCSFFCEVVPIVSVFVPVAYYACVCETEIER